MVNFFGKVAKGLDILSATLLEPTTFLKSPTKAGLLVAKRRKKVRAAPRGKVNIPALKVVGETLVSAGLGAALILQPKPIGKFIFKRPKASVGLATAGLVLTKSPRARKAVRSFPSTIATGADIIAKTIETGKSPVSPGKALLTGGIAAGIVAAGAGLLGAGKAIKGKIKPSLTLGDPKQTFTPTPPQIEPIGVAKQPKTLSTAVVEPIMPTINNKITVRPEVNVVVRNTKKEFINQQLIIMP